MSIPYAYKTPIYGHFGVIILLYNTILGMLTGGGKGGGGYKVVVYIYKKDTYYLVSLLEFTPLFTYLYMCGVIYEIPII